MTECEYKIGDDVQGHSGANQVNQVTPVNKFTGHDAIHNEPRCNQGVEPAGAPDAEFLGVEGDVVGNGAVGESDKNEICKLGKGAGEKESV